MSGPFQCHPPLLLVQFSSGVFQLDITARDYAGRTGGVAAGEAPGVGFGAAGNGGVMLTIDEGLEIDEGLLGSLGLGPQGEKEQGV